MSFSRGRFGIEYDTRQAERKPSGLGWVFAVVALVALVSFAWTLVGRLRSREEAPAEPPPAQEDDELARPPAAAKPPPAARPEVPPRALPGTLSGRPVKLRNLLMRLDEAERQNDVEMAVSTIEQIRALPGSPAADMDDSLARRLGTLNVRRLFERRHAQWVSTVSVKRGDSATRIAAENGSTLASLMRLNGGDLDKLHVGRKLYVMDHPRFSLVVHRRSRTADLSLNGKFFRRYDLSDEVRGSAGAYELPANARTLWRTLGVSFHPDARAELETLLPAGAKVLVSEL